jgi:hypothetical protein
VLLASGLAITASLVLERRIQRIDQLARREAALLASVPDALFVLDREGRIRQANAGLARLVPDARPGERLHPLLGHVLADGTACAGGCALDGGTLGDGAVDGGAVDSGSVDGGPVDSGSGGSARVAPVEGERITQAGRVIPVAYTTQTLAEDRSVAVSLRDVSARVAHQADRRVLLEAAARADEQARLIRALGSRSALPMDPSTGVRTDLGHLGPASRPGDSVDLSVLPDGRVLALIVDSPEVAVIAEQDAWKVLYTGRAHMAAGAPLGEMVARCAELLSGESGIPGATMLGVVLDPETGLVQVASGGHLPPLLVHPDGHAHWIEASGAPMGGPDAGSRSVATAELGPRDVLLLYTDAVVTGAGDAVEGLAALRSAAVALRHQDPVGWSQRLLAGMRPADGRDATVIALRLSEQAASGAA